MESTTDLQSAALLVHAAQERVVEARNAAQRRRSRFTWIERVVGVFSVLPEELELESAEAHLAKVTMQGREMVARWIKHAVNQALKDCPDEARRFKELSKRVASLKARGRQVQEWLELAREAKACLLSAAHACDSASGIELLDMMNTNKGMSAISFLQSASATESLQAAQEAIRALHAVLPKRADEKAFEGISDMPDLVLDLLFDPWFDVLSWLNIQRLDNAARECQEAAVKMGTLVDRLSTVTAHLQLAARQEDVARATITAPYVKAVTSQVPAVLSITMPATIAEGVAR